MEKTCKTCRWWADTDELAGYRTCSNALLNTRYDMDESDDSDDFTAPANGLNGSSGEYGVSTGPDFGCIHWELSSPAELK